MPQQYLTFPDIASAQARSAEQAKALGCDGTTQYWWSVQPLIDGTAAVVVDTDRPEFGATHPQKGVGLGKGERDALQSKAAITPKLPGSDAAVAAPAAEVDAVPVEKAK